MSLNNRRLYAKFLANIQWNGLAALYYQTLLTGSMLWLYPQLGATQYGIVGTLFALLYLMIELLDLGFEGALASSFRSWSSDRASFQRNCLRPASLQLLLLLGGTIGLISLAVNCSSWFAGRFQCCLLTPAVWYSVGLLLLGEGCHKLLRGIAQLLFLPKTLALAQITNISVYLLLVFGAWYSGVSLSITWLFWPLLISTALSCLILVVKLDGVYRQLPLIGTAPQQRGLMLTRAYWQNRWWIYLNQLSKLVYNGNLLITILASLFGVTLIAPLKLAYRLASYVKYVLYHALGLPVRTLLAQEQGLKMFRSAQLWRTIFSDKFWFSTIGFGLTSLAVISWITYQTGNFLHLSQLSASLFLVLLLLENLFLLPEQYLLVTRRLSWLALPNLLTALLLISSYYVQHFLPSTLVTLLQLTANQLLNLLLISLIVLRLLILGWLKLVLKKTVEKSSQ